MANEVRDLATAIHNNFLITGDEAKRSFDLNFLRILQAKHPELDVKYLIDFVQKAQLTGADPRTGQIFLTERNQKIKEFGQEKWIKVGTVVFAYQFFISVANKTGELDSFSVDIKKEAYFDPWDGKDIDTLVAYTTIKRKGRDPMTFKVYFKEVCQDNTMWRKMPHHMLEKTSIANAMRKVFPEALSGMYIDEEMGEDSPVIREVEGQIESNHQLTVAEQTVVEKDKKHEEITKKIEETPDYNEIPKLYDMLVKVCGEYCKDMSKDEKSAFTVETFGNVSFKEMKTKFSAKQFKDHIEAIQDLIHNKTEAKNNELRKQIDEIKEEMAKEPVEEIKEEKTETVVEVVDDEKELTKLTLGKIKTKLKMIANKGLIDYKQAHDKMESMKLGEARGQELLKKIESGDLEWINN